MEHGSDWILNAPVINHSTKATQGIGVFWRLFRQRILYQPELSRVKQLCGGNLLEDI